MRPCPAVNAAIPSARRSAGVRMVLALVVTILGSVTAPATAAPRDALTAGDVVSALDTLEVARHGLALGIFAGSNPRLMEAARFEQDALQTLARAAMSPEIVRELLWPERTRWLRLALKEREGEWTRGLLDALGDELPPEGAPSRGPASLALGLSALRVLDTDAEIGSDAPRSDPRELEARARRSLEAAAEAGHRLRDEAFYRLWLWAVQEGDTLAEGAWADSLALATPRSTRTPATRITRVRALLADGHPGEALKEARLALPAGDSAELRGEMYRALRAQGRLREAAYELESLVGHFGADPLAARAYGLREELGQKEPELALPARGRIQLARWLLPQKSSGAVEMLLAATTDDSLSTGDREEAALILARFFYKTKRYGEAEPLLEDLIESPRSKTVAEARMILARILRNTGRVERMEPHYRALIGAGGSNGGQAAWELGREMESLRNWAEAEVVWSLHLERFPNHGRRRDVWFRRGFVRVRLDRSEEAVEDFRRALRASKRGPDEEQAAFWLARTLRSLGRDEEALAAAHGGAWRTEPGDYYGVRLRAMLPDVETKAPPLPSSLPMRATDRLVQLVNGNTWPGPVAEHFRRGLELASLGELAVAREEWTRAATLDRNRASLFEALALAATVHHIYPEGVRWATRAAELLPRADPLRPGYLRLGFPAVHYGHLTREAARRGLEPERLWAIMRQESLYDPLAVSRAGAMGLMQILPATLRRIVREEGLAPLPTDALFRPGLNLTLGAGFFADRLEEFHGALLPTLAAYNAGEGKARQWRESSGGDTEEVFVECIGYPETKGYVRRIVWLIWVYRSYYEGE